MYRVTSSVLAWACSHRRTSLARPRARHGPVGLFGGRPPDDESRRHRPGRTLPLAATMAKLTVAVLALAAVVAAAAPSDAFYLPGIAPVDYEEGAKAEVLAARLTSAKNKVPYDIYSLPLCKPPAGLPRNKRHLSLGQVLVGERAQPTDFEFNVLVPTTCKVLCEFEVPVGAPLRRLHRRITDEYVVRLNLDNMPVVTRLNLAAADAAKATPSFMLGYPLGVSDASGAAYLYNHLKFRVLYHKPSATDVAAAAASAAAVASGTTRAPAYRIVGFEVEPMSVTHKMVDGEITTCPVNASTAVPLAVPMSTAGKSATAAMSNAITYDVEWVQSDRAWATRWDALLNANSAQVQIQWFSVVNSVRVGGSGGMVSAGSICLEECVSGMRRMPLGSCTMSRLLTGLRFLFVSGARGCFALLCTILHSLPCDLAWMPHGFTGDDCALPGRDGGAHPPPYGARGLCPLQPPGRRRRPGR